MDLSQKFAIFIVLVLVAVLFKAYLWARAGGLYYARHPEAKSRKDTILALDSKFYSECIEHPIPLELDSLRELRNEPTLKRRPKENSTRRTS